MIKLWWYRPTPPRATLKCGFVMKTAANSQRFEDFKISDVKKIIDEFLRKSNLKKAQK